MVEVTDYDKPSSLPQQLFNYVCKKSYTLTFHLKYHTREEVSDYDKPSSLPQQLFNYFCKKSFTLAFLSNMTQGGSD